MADTFNPDEYLSKKRREKDASASLQLQPDVKNFNPQEYLKKRQAGHYEGTFDKANEDLELSRFNPEDYLARKRVEKGIEFREKYGSNWQAAKAFGYAAGREGTFGASDIGVLESGLDNAEEMRNIKLANPTSDFLGSLLGGAGLLATTGGLAAPAEAMFGKGIAARVLGYGSESALMAAGTVISDTQLGDPEMNAEKALAHVTWGAALGAGAGIISHGIEKVLALRRAAKIPKELPAAPGAIPHTVPTAENPLRGAPQARSVPELEAQIKWAEEHAGIPNLTELPQKELATEAAERLRKSGVMGNVPITEMQINSLSSDAKRLAHQAEMELPGRTGDALRNGARTQKKFLDKGLDTTIKEIAPHYTPTHDAAEAGGRLAESLTKITKTIEEELGPAIGAIKKTAVNEVDHLPEVIRYLSNPEASRYGNPNIARLFDTSAKTTKLLPYNTGMLVDRKTYKAIRDMVTGIEKNPNEFETLFGIRKKMNQGINIMEQGDASTEITAAKAAFMDYLQDVAQKYSPDVKVRETFRNYAKNAENKEFIEKTLGAQIGENWRFVKEGKPEEAIMRKAFKNSAVVERLKEIMPQEEFNKALADYMTILKNDNTKLKGFSANNFNKVLQDKNLKYAFNEAFSAHPETYAKLQDIITTMTTFTDDIPANPSGTAKTIVQMLRNIAFEGKPVREEGTQYLKHKFRDFMKEQQINAELQGIKEKASALEVLKSYLKDTSKKIKSGASDIFSETAGTEVGKNFIRGATIAGGTYEGDRPIVEKGKRYKKEVLHEAKGGTISSPPDMVIQGETAHTDAPYEERVKELQNFQSNPDLLMDHLSKDSAGLYQAAPNITQSMNNGLVRGISFLNTKIPKAPTSFPMSRPWKASDVQKRTFNQYFNAIDKPMNILVDIKNGSLSNHAMEAVTSVYPQLLKEMQQEVFNQMTPEKISKLPYSKKVALSKFFGQPMEQNLTPQGLIANQMSLNTNLSQQSAPQSGRKSTLGGLKQLKMDSRTKPRGSRSVEDEK